jgi:hypothetical protein
MRKILHPLLTLIVLLGLTMVLAIPVLAMSGAIWTTDSGGNPVDQNIYGAKTEVYLNGGPKGGGGGLPDGNYYVQLTEPDGDVLGRSYPDTVTVSGGILPASQLTAILYTASSGFTAKGYDDTTNNGGEYKVWVSQDPEFPPSQSKTDNFKVLPPITPVPELPAIALFGVGLAGIGAFIIIKRRRSTISAG